MRGFLHEDVGDLGEETVRRRQDRRGVDRELNLLLDDDLLALTVTCAFFGFFFTEISIGLSCTGLHVELLGGDEVAVRVDRDRRLARRDVARSGTRRCASVEPLSSLRADVDDLDRRVRHELAGVEVPHLADDGADARERDEDAVELRRSPPAGRLGWRRLLRGARAWRGQRGAVRRRSSSLHCPGL